MSDYTLEEIKAATGEYGFAEEGSEYYDEEVPEWGYFPTLSLRGETIPVEWVAEAGGMDKGSYAMHVFKVGDQLFRKEGFYQSHYGYDWDGDLTEVEAYEKTVTDYREI